MPIIVTPYVPTYITVHLGTPDSDAENVTVAFLDSHQKRRLQRGAIPPGMSPRCGPTSWRRFPLP